MKFNLKPRIDGEVGMTKVTFGLQNLSQPDTFLILSASLMTLVFSFLPNQFLVESFVIDDALYYPRVILNLVAGYGVTYDQHTITNGFHPLWGVLLIPLAWLAGQDKALMLKLCFIFSGALLVLSIFYLRRLGKLWQWSAWAITASVLLLFFSRFDLWMSLMESVASLFVLILSLFCMERWCFLGARQISKNMIFGFLMACIFLVRLDQVFIVIAFFGVDLWIRLAQRQRTYEVFKAVSIQAFFTFLLVGPYLLANYFYFGSLVPVSGLKKHQGMSGIQFVDGFLFPFRVISEKTHLHLGIIWVASLIIATLALKLCVSKRKTIFRMENGVILGFLTGVLARWIYLRIFMRESVDVSWYWVPEYLAASLCIGFGITYMSGRVWRWRPHWVLNTVLAGALFLSGMGFVLREAYSEAPSRAALFEMASWAKGNISSKTLCGMYDSGIFSYFSELNTIALNGLIGDRQLMLEASERRYGDTIRRYQLECLVQHFSADELARVEPASILHISPIPWKNGEKLGSLVLLDPTRDPRFGVSLR